MDVAVSLPFRGKPWAWSGGWESALQGEERGEDSRLSAWRDDPGFLHHQKIALKEQFAHRPVLGASLLPPVKWVSDSLLLPERF